MDRYPILKNWRFENEEVFKNMSKQVIEDTINDLQQVEKFINLYSERKFVFNSKVSLKANVFGKEGYPDNSEICTSKVLELEKGLDINPHIFRKVLIATTETGSKYELDIDDDVKIDTSLLEHLL